MTVLAVIVPADEAKPLLSQKIPEDMDDNLGSLTRTLQESEVVVEDLRQTLLLRSTSSGNAGLIAYSFTLENQRIKAKNVRATRLAMACGRFSCTLYGNVLLVRSSLSSRKDLRTEEVFGACCISLDLRPSVQKELLQSTESLEYSKIPPPAPEWLGNALRQNYHDQVVLDKLADVMTPRDIDDDSGSSSDEDDDDDGDESNTRASETYSDNLDSTLAEHKAHKDPERKRQFVTKQPLCLHCRKPASTLCPRCKAAYFCDPPRQCRELGWTHECVCPTWKLYADRRDELSTFSSLGEWTRQLHTTEFHSSEEPYEQFLRNTVKVHIVSNEDSSAVSWWSTELYGWAGGESQSAKTVDVSIRKSYSQGFDPLSDIPPQRPVMEEDVARARVSRNALGFLDLKSWEQYYRLRQIPFSSPVALLCTFPLTIYYAILKYGEVPCTVARMLKRPLRIHIVGVEKEANFLDLFQEVGFLLPESFPTELVFIVRQDMLPPKCRQPGTSSYILKLDLTTNLTIWVVSGTYGASLDPNFDCGTGPPDMVIGLNAGLYAYDTWRSVVTYLDNNKGVVGVFTDYNEHSGVNCASLGGSESRESLSINPFRQPLAMPVWSMNLPQTSNGFFYVFNQQELE